MKTFKSITDIEQLLDHPLHTTVESLVVPVINEYAEYVPGDDGYLVLIEPGDVDRELNELDMPSLADVLWEGASMRGNFFYAVYLGTDDYGMGFVIPDAPWMNGKLRKTLEEILDQQPRC